MDKGMTHLRFLKGGSLHLSNDQIPGYVLVYTQGNTIRHNDPWNQDIMTKPVFLGWTSDLDTPPKTNMDPEKDGFQKESPFPGVHFQVPC